MTSFLLDHQWRCSAFLDSPALSRWQGTLVFLIFCKSNIFYQHIYSIIYTQASEATSNTNLYCFLCLATVIASTIILWHKHITIYKNCRTVTWYIVYYAYNHTWTEYNWKNTLLYIHGSYRHLNSFPLLFRAEKHQIPRFTKIEIMHFQAFSRCNICTCNSFATT